MAVSRGLPRPSGRDWLGLVVIGVLWFGVYNVALNQGERHVDAGTAAMLIQISPVLIAAARHDLPRRAVHGLARRSGSLLAFAGVVLIGVSQPGGHNDLLGVRLCLLAALVYSISLVVQKPLVSRLSALHVTWLACTIGALVCLPFAGQLVDDTSRASASDIWWVVYLGLFPTAIAFTTYAFALRHMTASSLGITTYLVPPLTIVMGWLFLGEVPPTMAYVGGALALVGVAVARRKPRAARSRPSPPDAASPALPCCAREHRRRRAGRPGRRAAPLLPGARDVPVDHAHRAARLRARRRASPSESKALAANQGLYNGFLVAGPGLGPGLRPTDVKVFFLVCVVVAGVYGAATVNRRILVVQAVPAVLALGGGRAQLTRVEPEPRQAGLDARRSRRSADRRAPGLRESAGRAGARSRPFGELVRLSPLSTYPSRRETASDGALSSSADETAATAPRCSKASASTPVAHRRGQPTAADVGGQPRERVDRAQQRELLALQRLDADDPAVHLHGQVEAPRARRPRAAVLPDLGD